MQKPLRWYDSLTINIYFFGLTLRAQTLTPLILPLLVQQFVGDANKGASYGNIRLYSLMIAVLVQALAGMFSDRSTSRWGKRRPFMLASSLLESITFIAIGIIAARMEGQAGYNALFAAVIASMVFSNVGQGAAQGLIPDLVPPEKQGRFAGIKALLELPLPLIFMAFFVSRMIAAGNLWGAITTVIITLLVCTAIAMLVHETPQEKAPYPLDWKAIGRLIAMTAAFTLVILFSGWAVQQLIPLVSNLQAGSSPALTILIGLIGMLIAVVVGVLVSLRLSLGEESQEKPAFTWWVINRLAFLVAASNLASFLLYFLQERFPGLQGNAAAQPATLLVMATGIAILLAALPAGWLADKIGTKPVLAVSGIIAAAGTLVVIAAQDMSTMTVGAVLVGVASGAFYSANWALGTQIVPKKEAGRYLGISNLAGAGAGAIGAYIGGPIGDSSGYVVQMAIYAALFLFSTLALLRIKPANHKAEHA